MGAVIDALTLAIGAALPTVGFLVGLVVGQRRRTPEPIRPICACSHPVSTHKAGGPCRADVRRMHYYPSGDRNGWEWVSCACLRYVGPEPITSDIWVPPVAEVDR